MGLPVLACSASDILDGVSIILPCFSRIASLIMAESPSHHLLMFSNDEELVEGVQEALEPLGVQVMVNGRAPDFLISLKRDRWSLVLIDTEVGLDRSELITATRKLAQDVPLLAVVPVAEIDFMAEALQLGASDVIALPFDDRTLRARVLARMIPGDTAIAGEPVPSAFAALLRDLVDFHERSVQSFVALERKVLELKERLGEVEPLDTENSDRQRILLVHSDPSLSEQLEETAEALNFEIVQVFTGGGALETAGEQDLDGVVCQAELPDLDGGVVSTSLKGEYPFLDTLVVYSHSPVPEAHLLGDYAVEASERFELPPEEPFAAVLALLGSRRTKRSHRRQLATVFQRKHSDYMRQYAALKIRLLEALGEEPLEDAGPW